MELKGGRVGVTPRRGKTSAHSQARRSCAKPAHAVCERCCPPENRRKTPAPLAAPSVCDKRWRQENVSAIPAVHSYWNSNSPPSQNRHTFLGRFRIVRIRKTSLYSGRTGTRMPRTFGGQHVHATEIHLVCIALHRSQRFCLCANANYYRR